MSKVKCTCKTPPMPDGCVYHGIAPTTPPATVTASEGEPSVAELAAAKVVHQTKSPSYESDAILIAHYTRAADGDGVLRDATWWKGSYTALKADADDSDFKGCIEVSKQMKRAEAAERVIAALQSKVKAMEAVMEYIPKFMEHSICGYTHVEKEFKQRLAVVPKP